MYVKLEMICRSQLSGDLYDYARHVFSGTEAFGVLMLCDRKGQVTSGLTNRIGKRLTVWNSGVNLQG